MSDTMDPIQISIFVSRVESICLEMGVVLRRAAFSPNIKDRLDFSCALFDARGQLFAQAAHIPVHLGSMAFAMSDIVSSVDWRPGDMLVMNDPFMGGTHLPDVTLVAPLFIGERLLAFVANRAHHANIGARSPGSMPVSSRIHEEGVIISPTFILRAGESVPETVAYLDRIEGASSGQGVTSGDFAAQISANRIGLNRLVHLVESMGSHSFLEGIDAVNEYGERVARAVLGALPEGAFEFCDFMDDDGQGTEDVPIRIRLSLSRERIVADFSGTADQVEGNINCPLPVTAAAVFYVFRCMLPADAPSCAGIFRCIRIEAPEGSLLNARSPAAVAAGNVETSQRIVDVMLGALYQAIPERVPAASQGTMNNIAMGSRGEDHWDYYETLGGGMGAHSTGEGLSAVHSHMTNTLNTPVESVEMHYPLRIARYGIRRGSGGSGLHGGGDGLVREYVFEAPTAVTLLTERRRYAPWGLDGGESGQRGANMLNDRVLPGKCEIHAKPGDRLVIGTPGGGGWGRV